MSRIIRAKVITNSSEDEFSRVKIACDGVWNEDQGTPLIESVGGIPLKSGDLVFVDVSDGFENPIIVGRSMGSLNHYGKDVNGSLLFESSDGSNFTIAFVKNNNLEVYNSDNTSIVVNKGTIDVKSGSSELSITNGDITIKASSIKLETGSGKITGGTFEMQGTCSPTGSGPFCGIPYCLLTGAPHSGTTVSGT